MKFYCMRMLSIIIKKGNDSSINCQFTNNRKKKILTSEKI